MILDKIPRFALSLAMISGTLPAAITFVDAEPSNTTLANGTAYLPSATLVNDDNEWSNRAFGNGGALYTANDSNSNPGENAPTLRTQVTGLEPGSYSVFVYFWGAGTTGNAQWDIQAGFTPTTLTTFDFNNALSLGDGYINDSTVFDSTTFTSPVMVEEGNRDLLQGSLGTITVDGSGILSVYVDDNPGNDDRTWFDGIGYERQVIPEPSTILLGLLGLFPLAHRRR